MVELEGVGTLGRNNFTDVLFIRVLDLSCWIRPVIGLVR